MTPHRLLIGSAIIAGMSWLALLLDAFTPLKFLAVDDVHSMVITLAGAASVGLAIAITRRPILEVYELGIEHGRRLQIRESNVCKVTPIGARRGQRDAAAQAAFKKVVEVAVADALSAAETIRADTHN